MNDNDTNDDVPHLSADTLLALKQFALSSGIATAVEDDDVMDAVAKHFDVNDNEKYEIFHFSWGANSSLYSSVVSNYVELNLRGVRRDLGQTLNSTGLTVWVAAEYMCDWLYHNQALFVGKTVCELGCGLGVVSLLLAKVGVAQCVIATDGDDDTMDLLRENVDREKCSSLVCCQKLVWGDPSGGSENLLQSHPKRFDFLLAADVVYEDDQVLPLVQTAGDLLADGGSFYLSFFPRNVPAERVQQAAVIQGLCWESVPHEWRWSPERIQGFRLERIFRFWRPGPG